MAEKMDLFGEASPTYQKHLKYMQSVIPRLLEAETVVHEIKNSAEWTRSLNYFNVLYKRGRLACRPTFENGYTIKPAEYISLDKIEDILTPEQREIVLQRIKDAK